MSVKLRKLPCPVAPPLALTDPTISSEPDPDSALPEQAQMPKKPTNVMRLKK